MISIKVLNDWHTLDTINGYYKLNDLFKLVGSPEGFDPETFVRTQGPHSDYSIQRKKHIWATRLKLYSYAAFLDEEFNETMLLIADTINTDIALTLALSISTGVQHK